MLLNFVKQKMSLGQLLTDARLEHCVHKRSADEHSCPGGVGNYGFNTYDFLTLMLLSYNMVGNAVVNTNKNENNNNNNDFQSALGQINTNENTVSADQTSTNMAMITVPPGGVPIVVPMGGRMLRDGRVILEPGTEVPGVSWKSRDWQVFDNGTVWLRESNRFVTKGLQVFGTVDHRNVFHLLPKINGGYISWETLRRMNSGKVRAARNNSPLVLEASTAPIFVQENDLDLLYQEAIRLTGSQIVLVATFPIGPPVILSLGSLVRNGRVLLNPGIEIEGVYWDSPDRTFFENGTVVYKQTGIVEHTTNVTYGTLNEKGAITELTFTQGSKADMRVLRGLNLSPDLGHSTKRRKRSLDALPKPLSSFHGKLNFVSSFMNNAANSASSGSELENQMRYMTCEFLFEDGWNDNFVKHSPEEDEQKIIQTIERLCT